MTFGSNFKKKKSLVVLTAVIAIFGIVMAEFQFAGSKSIYLVTHDYAYDRTRTHSAFYANQATAESFLLAPQIDQEVTKSKVIKLFIPIFSYEEKHYLNFCGPVTEVDEDRPNWYLDCYTAYHEVLLNDKKIETVFLKFRHAETDQRGIIAYLDIRDANWGNNMIKVKKKLKDGEEWEIPFQWVGEE